MSSNVTEQSQRSQSLTVRLVFVSFAVSTFSATMGDDNNLNCRNYIVLSTAILPRRELFQWH